MDIPECSVQNGEIYLVIEDDNLTATYDFQGNLVDFKGTFEGDTFKGMSSAGGYEIPMEAQRRQE